MTWLWGWIWGVAKVWCFVSGAALALIVLWFVYVFVKFLAMDCRDELIEIRRRRDLNRQERERNLRA